MWTKQFSSLDSWGSEVAPIKLEATMGQYLLTILPWTMWTAGGQRIISRTAFTTLLMTATQVRVQEFTAMIMIQAQVPPSPPKTPS